MQRDIPWDDHFSSILLNVKEVSNTTIVSTVVCTTHFVGVATHTIGEKVILTQMNGMESIAGDVGINALNYVRAMDVKELIATVMQTMNVLGMQGGGKGVMSEGIYLQTRIT